ncbi:hypothetical protein NMYAN_20358 [Nitrosomonas nitrosa]|uniref:Uncharacterized protein n=1 Tax=Nitrosomonas nitrosa TaxID=52442 RepID=A0A8H8Z0H4_9PROT|nr:hypothetical protein NMYAN_20358 [Nitrosomonas nitrosa]
MAELVDAPDLGSGADEVWGFESPLSHQKIKLRLNFVCILSMVIRRTSYIGGYI